MYKIKCRKRYAGQIHIRLALIHHHNQNAILHTTDTGSDAHLQSTYTEAVYSVFYSTKKS